MTAVDACSAVIKNVLQYTLTWSLVWSRSLSSPRLPFLQSQQTGWRQVWEDRTYWLETLTCHHEWMCRPDMYSITSTVKPDEVKCMADLSRIGQCRQLESLSFTWPYINHVPLTYEHKTTDIDKIAQFQKSAEISYLISGYHKYLVSLLDTL